MKIVQYYSSMRKKEILPIATIWIDFVGILLSKKKLDKERQILYDITYIQKPNS